VLLDNDFGITPGAGIGAAVRSYAVAEPAGVAQRK
jgi:hypothetical protein